MGESGRRAVSQSAQGNGEKQRHEARLEVGLKSGAISA